MGHWALLRYGSLAIISKESGQLLGDFGLFESHRDLGPDFDGYTEVAWILNQSAQHQGIAIEAARAALKWLERTHAPALTVCLIGSKNEPSLRLADKLGYKRFRLCTYKDVDHVMLGRLSLTRPS